VDEPVGAYKTLVVDGSTFKGAPQSGACVLHHFFIVMRVFCTSLIIIIIRCLLWACSQDNQGRAGGAIHASLPNQKYRAASDYFRVANSVYVLGFHVRFATWCRHVAMSLVCLPRLPVQSRACNSLRVSAFEEVCLICLNGSCFSLCQVPVQQRHSRWRRCHALGRPRHRFLLGQELRVLRKRRQVRRLLSCFLLCLSSALCETDSLLL
jgi:hypothetical protein